MHLLPGSLNNGFRQIKRGLLIPSSAAPLSFSRKHSAPTYRNVNILENGSTEIFRRKAFLPAFPAVLPRGQFSHLPAVKRWFIPQHQNSDGLTLNHAYLHEYGATIVPLEMTGSSATSVSRCLEQGFQRFNAPLSLFLDWSHSKNSERTYWLYLAQAQVTELPHKLRDDLPTPQLVAEAGKGDIYDANIWIGLAPTYTPLHRDPNPNLFVQLAGAKVVRLFEPDVGAEIYRKVQSTLGRAGSSAFRGEEMMHGEEKPLLEAEVWGQQDTVPKGATEGYQAQMGQGDGLFIPKGWWHSIKGTGEGITGSVSILGSIAVVRYVGY